jgi:KDO2-lipid IV(A) lauroyltransferase
MSTRASSTADQKNLTLLTRACSEQPLPWIKVKDLLWFLYLYPARWVSRTAPPTLKLFLQLIEPAFQVFSAPRRHEVERKLAVAFGPATPPPRIKAIARRFVANFVWRAGDDLMLLRDPPPVHCRSFRGREHLDAALAAGKGVLLVSLHWYAGRAANRYLETAGYPVLTVRNEEPPDELMGRLGRRFLQPRYIRLLHDVIRDEVFIQDRECSLKILSRLRIGGIVDLHLDPPFSRRLIEHPFLGEPLQFPVGFFHLARNSGSAVLPMLVRGCAQDLEIRIAPPLPLDRSLPFDEFCLAHLSPLVRIFESYVLEYPDQWELWTRL